jgi:CheY-like chemotaxis protein
VTSTIDVRARLRWSTFVPIAIQLCVGGLLAFQVFRLMDSANRQRESMGLVAKMYEAQKLAVDQETSLRGYLLTMDSDFLQPFREADPDRAFRQVLALTQTGDKQHRVAEDARAVYALWRDSAASESQVDRLDSGFNGRMLGRKVKMDKLRALVSAFIAAEDDERSALEHDVRASMGTTLLLILGLTVAASVALVRLSRSNIDAIATTFEAALAGERTARDEMERERWVGAGEMRLAEAIQGERSMAELGTAVLLALSRHTGAQVATFSVVGLAGTHIVASLGMAINELATREHASGEGLIGRAVHEESALHIRDLAAGQFRASSGVGDFDVGELVLATARVDAVPYAVVELGFIGKAPAGTVRLVEAISNKLALAVRSTEYKARLRVLLDQSRQQSEELRAQQEELRVTNEELTEQSRALSEAHARVQEQREELIASNERLRERTKDLEESKFHLDRKAEELETASRYKSEFLANMSHELRTPLNSMLILAGILAENRASNLSVEQVKFAATIRTAGNDLLCLINEILDLSKVEAGQLQAAPEWITLADELVILRELFEPVAIKNCLAFDLSIAPNVTPRIFTDAQRLQQILRNLLSNAFKFTIHGGVSLCVSQEQSTLSIAVLDTGIGIPPEQHATVFEAFQQADGTTNRRFGGTGLGLTIGRDLARLLGGELCLTSGPGQGSVFTLTLPVELPRRDALSVPIDPGQRPFAPTESRARSSMEPKGDAAPVRRGKDAKTEDPAARDGLRLLLVEDDPLFAELVEVEATRLGFHTVLAGTADDGVRLAREHRPHAVILDMKLPDHSGLTVLDRMKRDPELRHIPVHVMSAMDLTQQALSMGAIGYLAKPANQEQLTAAIRSIEERIEPHLRRILVVEDDENQRDSMRVLLCDMGAAIVTVGTVAAALEELRNKTFDCVVTDLSLPDARGEDLLEAMAQGDRHALPPVIIYTGRSLSETEEMALRRHSAAIIIKGARSPERLLEEVTLFLHKVEGDLPPEKQRTLQHVRECDANFHGKTILVADDDVRNVFAISALLEPRGAVLRIARNGREAIESLRKHRDVDLVLMDMMMPEMDGMTAIGLIRQERWGAKLPIIALTAKAMTTDRQACLDAGASDYISKPLDVDTLLSLMRKWMTA